MMVKKCSLTAQILCCIVLVGLVFCGCLLLVSRNAWAQERDTPQDGEAQFWTQPYLDALERMQVNGKWGYADLNGREVIPPRFDWAGIFVNGRAWVLQKGKWGYVNNLGKFNPHYEEREGFSRNGLLAVKALDAQGGKWGYINQKGEEVIPPRFDFIYDFSERIMAVKINNKWGFIDSVGKEVIPPRFDYVTHLSEGLAAVKINNKWGFIDSAGKEVIPPRFDSAHPFSGGLAGVKIDEKFGYVNQKGNLVIAPRFDYAGEFHKGLANVHINNKWGYINTAGKFVIEPRGWVHGFIGDLALEAVAGEYGKIYSYFNTNGEKVIGPLKEGEFAHLEIPAEVRGFVAGISLMGEKKEKTELVFEYCNRVLFPLTSNWYMSFYYAERSLVCYDVLQGEYSPGQVMQAEILLRKARVLAWKAKARKEERTKRELQAILEEMDLRFGDSNDPAIRAIYVQSLIERVVVLKEGLMKYRPITETNFHSYRTLKQNAEQIAAYDVIADRYERDAAAGARAQAAIALLEKSKALQHSDLDTNEQYAAIAVLSDLDQRFGKDAAPEVRAVVLEALSRKADFFGKREEAVRLYDEICRRFGQETKAIQCANESRKIERARTITKAKADAQYRQGNTEAALTEYVDYQNQHPGDDWPLFEQVKLLEQFERFSEAITILAEIEQRFGASSPYRNAKIVGKSLCKRGKLLEKQGKFAEALFFYDETERRFGKAGFVVCSESPEASDAHQALRRRLMNPDV